MRGAESLGFRPCLEYVRRQVSFRKASAELEAHVREEHSTFAWILEGMLQRAGFRVDDADYDDSKIIAWYVAVRR